MNEMKTAYSRFFCPPFPPGGQLTAYCLLLFQLHTTPPYESSFQQHY